jgi:endo-1,4-beta-xylanase
MKKFFFGVFLLSGFLFSGDAETVGQAQAWGKKSNYLPSEIPSLKDKYKDHFLIGTVISVGEFPDPKAREIYEKHCSIVTLNPFYWGQIHPEVPFYPFHWGGLHPEEGVYYFDRADELMEYVSGLNLKVHGHPLLFGSLDPEWIFRDGDRPISRDKLIERMKDHIHTVVGRYKGRINYWDVVNEPTADPFFNINMEASAITDIYKKVPWYKIIGEEYVEMALRFAHEADPDAKLFVNENNIFGPASNLKRRNFIKIIKNLLDKGAPLHGVGLQGHFASDYPPLGDICETIKIFSDMGLEVHITELDMSTYSMARWVAPGLVPEHDSYNTRVESRQRHRYKKLFEELRSCSDDVSAVIFWGLKDENSWLNTVPDKRNDWPLLFHGEYETKKVFWDIVDF